MKNEEIEEKIKKAKKHHHYQKHHSKRHGENINGSKLENPVELFNESLKTKQSEKNYSMNNEEISEEQEETK